MAESTTRREQGDAGAHETSAFSGRYQLHELLGRGGMASVHRATELATGREVALKQLQIPERDEQRASLEYLFEREFHTLSELKHPHVIAVYDFGVTSQGASYYTMELLDGGDLRERVPLPWREACRLFFDVCSSLAQLHSRRLLHRDISPRNIRCTRDGSAKLIDFGALAPMSGGGSPVVGTPAFTAPETVHRSALDARTDLYAVGASLYYALTGKLPYPARTFAELFTSWNEKPAPPSTRVPGIPPKLDDLILSLLSLEPALRPPSAFEVMQRLAAIADLSSEEAASVSRAYLATPALVGRDALLSDLREQLVRALSVGGKGVLVRGETGLGRSRVLDACALQAKTIGARVLRATASGTPRDFEVALALTQHLVEALPSPALVEQFPELFEPLDAGRPRLRDLARLRKTPEQLQQSLARLLRAASKVQPLVVAVDDVHRIDEPSAAVIAALIDRARLGRAFVALTAETGAAGSTQALDVLSRRCGTRDLAPLTLSETQELFGSVFGDVPGLAGLSEEIHAIARGNPRQSMELAQHLIDRQVITYAAGTWTLPRSSSSEHLPRSAEAAIEARLARLTPLARFLAEAHALSFVERFTPEMYRALAAGFEPRAADAAVNELASQQALVGDGHSYVIANRLWSSVLEAGLDAAGRAARHRALYAFFRPRSEVAWIQHAFSAGADEEEAALDGLLALQRAYVVVDHTQAVELQLGRLAASYPRAVAVAEELGRPARQVHEILSWFTAVSIAAGEPSLYWQAAPRWLPQLIHDTGLDLWRLDTQTLDAGARLTSALTKAVERHGALPERERVYRVDEAIPQLATYVAVSIAIAARTMDVRLMKTLPPLLEPFAPLSPLLDALWQNAVGALETLESCQYERARARWIEIYGKLESVSGVELQHVTAIRNAIAYAIGMLEATLGLASAARWADVLENDPYQRVSALYLRKIVRLEQGDWTGADKLQRQAEVLALRTRMPQMFASTPVLEIIAHASARDLAGVKDVIERERIEAAHYPGWVPYLREAEARFELIRGDFAGAKALYDRLMPTIAPDEHAHSVAMPTWVAAQGGLCEALLGLGRFDEARETALAALAICERNQIRAFAYELERMLALAEAKRGDVASANARLDRMIAEQTALGVTGLRIGLSYEARAEIALWSDDAAAFDRYSKLTAREYRHGARCPLGARYDRLTHEARRRGIVPSAALTDFETTTVADSSAGDMPDLQTAVRIALAGADDAHDRYLRALRMVCSSRAARGGHLFLPANDGPQLVASCDLAPPATQLNDLIRDYLSEQEDRFDTLTIALDQDASVTPTSAIPTARVEGIDYELMLLTCMQNSEAQIAGIMAIAAGEQPRTNPRQSQLLSTIAAHLVSGT